MAECGLRQSTDHGLAQDIELIAAGDSGWAKTLRKLVDDFASLPAEERQELLALLPKPWAETLNEIQQRRADKPEEATSETLTHVLQNRWPELAGKAIEEQLRERTATAVSIPATATKPATATQQK